MWPTSLVSLPCVLMMAMMLAVSPRELWHLDTETGGWTRVTDGPDVPDQTLVVPTLERFSGRDGLALTV